MSTNNIYRNALISEVDNAFRFHYEEVLYSRFNQIYEDHYNPDVAEPGTILPEDSLETADQESRPEGQLQKAAISYPRKTHSKSKDILSRKITALPLAAVAVIKVIYHLALFVLVGMVLAICCKRLKKYRKIYAFTLIRDGQEIFGRLAVLFNDRYGLFHIQESNYYKNLYPTLATRKASGNTRPTIVNLTPEKDFAHTSEEGSAQQDGSQAGQREASVEAGKETTLSTIPEETPSQLQTQMTNNVGSVAEIIRQISEGTETGGGKDQQFLKFAQECFEKKDKKNAEEVLKKVLILTPETIEEYLAEPESIEINKPKPNREFGRFLREYLKKGYDSTRVSLTKRYLNNNNVDAELKDLAKKYCLIKDFKSALKVVTKIVKCDFLDEIFWLLDEYNNLKQIEKDQLKGNLLDDILIELFDAKFIYNGSNFERDFYKKVMDKRTKIFNELLEKHREELTPLLLSKNKEEILKKLNAIYEANKEHPDREIR